MKTTILIVAMACLSFMSCKKTYQCINEVDAITGEVEASSQKKANSLCPEGSGAVLK